LPPGAAAGRKLLLGTYGSVALAGPALRECKRQEAALVVCFIRHVALSWQYEAGERMTIETDAAAQRTFATFLDAGHEMNVPVIPVYDTGPDAAELLAESAAIYGCSKVLIGTSRQGPLYHLIKGHFHDRLERLLPEDVPVEVLAPQDVEPRYLNSDPTTNATEANSANSSVQ
jgi:hypothetical protein